MADPFRATSTRWFIWDGLGISCTVFTYLLIGYGEFVVVCVMLLPEIPDISWGFLHAILFSLLVILAIAAHVRAMVTDPGSIPLGNCTGDNLKKLQLKEGEVVLRCTRCQCIKLDRAHHCSTCQRCIRKMDHHCPWINNCVGETNQKYFILFTFYVMAISGYAMLLAVRKLFLCMDMDWQGCMYMSLPASILFIIFLIFEALLFGIFTLVMLCTQVNSVVTDETGIEYLKKEKIRRQTSMYQNLQEVFGGKFSISWLSPFASPVQHRKKPFAYHDV